MITGTNAILRAPTEEDYPVLLKIRNNFELQSLLLALPKANDIQKIKHWIDKNLTDNNTVFFIISLKQNNQAIGFIQLKNINLLHGFGDLGICIDNNFQGKGFAYEAIKLMELYLKDIFNIRKICLNVMVSNIRAINLYKKLDFLEIGILRKHFYYKNSHHDILIMEKFINE